MNMSKLIPLFFLIIINKLFLLIIEPFLLLTASAISDNKEYCEGVFLTILRRTGHLVVKKKTLYKRLRRNEHYKALQFRL